MFKHWKWTGLLCTALIAITLASSGLIEGKGKPPKDDGGGGGGGEEPTLPPVRYQVQFFDLPYQDSGMDLRGTNNSGQAVGRIFHTVDGTRTQSAFLYDPERSLTSAIDLNTIVAGIPPGWKLRNATAINSSGDIAVYLILEGAPTLTFQAAMIDMNAVDPETGEPLPQLHIIPDAAVSENSGLTFSTDMNDFGDIVATFIRADGTRGAYVYNFGLYDPSLATETPFDLEITVISHFMYINNPTVDRDVQVTGIVDDGTFYGTVFRDTLGGAFETFPPVPDELTGNVTELIFPTDINDAGEFCGKAKVSYPKKIKGQNGETRCYVQGSSLETFTMDDDVAKSLNESSDFITYSDFSPFVGVLYHRSYIEGGGALLVSDLLDPTDSGAIVWANSVEAYLLEGISDRETLTDFPQLFGRADFIDGSTAGFVLSPIPYP